MAKHYKMKTDKVTTYAKQQQAKQFKVGLAVIVLIVVIAVLALK